MLSNASFGSKIATGFVVAVALTIATAWVAVYALRDVVSAKDHVIESTTAALTASQQLKITTEQSVAAVRGFLISNDGSYLEELAAGRREFSRLTEELRRLGADEGAVRNVERAQQDYSQSSDAVIAMSRAGATAEQISAAFVEKVRPHRQALTAAVDNLEARRTAAQREATQKASDTAAEAERLLIGIAAIAGVVAALIALTLTRTLQRQIGSAVGQVQSSAAELQAAANQQATGLREQNTAVAEISTTIGELLTTSRQISESARRVAQMAEQTAIAAREGDATANASREAVAGIRTQIDRIVSHMLELGRKSQQIGGVLDLVTELAEQTNILSINATIEATGAGEAGRRFGVVADEIRKLADRVGGSTKEVRGLIDEIRGAVNTTVMATETGAKVIDAGSRRFEELTQSFSKITGLVGTTTEAAREIELSTKQQASAVEQVNTAITNVGQATKEAEASSSQTLQTSSQLASLSRDLLRLVRPEAV